jgi:hypothetical protein
MSIENNKLIAEFMGMKYSDERSFNNGEWTYSIRSLNKFKTSWDWLMSVVKKIEQIEGSYEIEEFLLIRDELCTGRIETSYLSVVEFIKWYNNKTK